MELAANAFKVVLFVVPGYAAWFGYKTFVPSRRSDSDAEVVINGIAGSAIIWAAAAFLAWLYFEVQRWIDWSTGLEWHLDVWARYIEPTLTTKDATLGSTIVGGIISVAALAGGVFAAWWVRGQPKGFKIGKRLKFDPCPRVWNLFLQTPQQKGEIFRVQLKSGTLLAGQISEYSTEPHDEVQEIVMVRYSVAKEGTWEPVRDSRGLLLSRDDIEMIEELVSANHDEEALKQLVPEATVGAGAQPATTS